MSRIVTFGEVMAQFSPPGSRRLCQTLPGALDVTFAGAEVNVAAALAFWGADVSFVSALPRHGVADAALALLRGLGMDLTHVLRPAEGRLGLYYYEKGAGTRPGAVIYDREGSSFALQTPEAWDWSAVFAGAEWFHLSGVTPAISRGTAAAAQRAAQEAAARGVRISFDMNFRSLLWQWQPGVPPAALAARTAGEIVRLSSVFMGAPGDAALLTGQAAEQESDPPAAAARALARQFPHLSLIALTARHGAGHAEGLLYEPAADTFHRVPAAISQTVDRLGTGDAFAAGVLLALTSPDMASPAAAASFATAAFALAHTVEGDFCLVSRAEVEACGHSDKSGGVRR